MGDAIREQSDDDKDPRAELLVEYKEETPLEIHEIQLDAGIPHDTENKNLCKHTQDAQTILVITTKWSTQRNSGKKLSGSSLPKLGKTTFSTKAKSLKSASEKMTSIGTVIKETIIPHRKGNIRLNPEFVVLEDSHIQGFLLGTDYQRMYGIDIHKSQNRHITIGKNKEKKFLVEIYNLSSHDPLDELLNEFREGLFSTTLTSK
ncbi:hypothetical protein O181_013087 [Austropuccinia psidii MF-1]|uniref:Uncharacterized protein n=1 Tax=Austropuccinia psidii MF-1 TaxID=1389203 RepID=A0A9Q3BYY4_9BASI|nr:hypothetical protein [Austropuccinia psidii MF-1]